MPTVDLTEDSFESTIAENDIVLVDFWADWCRPCHLFAPIFESASETHDDLVFAKVDTESQPVLMHAFGIRSIPTLMVFRDNVLVFNQAGVLPGHVLENLIEQVRDLDMDDVRAQIAAAEQDAEPA